MSSRLRSIRSKAIAFVSRARAGVDPMQEIGKRTGIGLSLTVQTKFSSKRPSQSAELRWGGGGRCVGQGLGLGWGGLVGFAYFGIGCGG